MLFCVKHSHETLAFEIPINLTVVCLLIPISLVNDKPELRVHIWIIFHQISHTAFTVCNQHVEIIFLVKFVKIICLYWQFPIMDISKSTYLFSSKFN